MNVAIAFVAGVLFGTVVAFAAMWFCRGSHSTPRTPR